MKRKVFGIFPDLLVVQDVPVRPCFEVESHQCAVEFINADDVKPMLPQASVSKRG